MLLLMYSDCDMKGSMIFLTVLLDFRCIMSIDDPKTNISRRPFWLDKMILGQDVNDV